MLSGSVSDLDELDAVFLRPAKSRITEPAIHPITGKTIPLGKSCPFSMVILKEVTP